MSAPATDLLEHELEPGKFICVNCGAPITFGEAEETELERAACEYCDVVNERALAELRKAKARERHEERVRLERRRKALKVGATGLGVLFAVTLFAMFATQASLTAAQSEVRRQRAQLQNVRERQQVVLEQWTNAPAGPDRDAELSGAENRVRIERARYDEAASAYNAKVGSLWPGLVARTFGLPSHAKLSDEPDW